MGAAPWLLPLGELSPQVTERVLQPFTEIPVDIIVYPLRPRCARPPLPEGEARCFPGYVSPSAPRCARPPLPQGEARCFPGYVSPSPPRRARPPLPKGEARDARAVHRKVYRSAPLASLIGGVKGLALCAPQHKKPEEALASSGFSSIKL